MNDQVGPEFAERLWIGGSIGGTCLSMLVESFKAFVSLTGFGTSPLVVCAKTARFRIEDKRVVPPSQNDCRFHVFRIELTIIPSRLGGSAFAFEFLDDFCFPEATVAWVLNMPFFLKAIQ